MDSKHLETEALRAALEDWRTMAGRLALACLASPGKFREEILQEYKALLEKNDDIRP